MLFEVTEVGIQWTDIHRHRHIPTYFLPVTARVNNRLHQRNDGGFVARRPSVCLSVRPSVSHDPVLYQNG